MQLYFLLVASERRIGKRVSRRLAESTRQHPVDPHFSHRWARNRRGRQRPDAAGPVRNHSQGVAVALQGLVCKLVKTWRREWDSNLGVVTKSTNWEARMAKQPSKNNARTNNSTFYWTLNGRWFSP